MAIDMTTVKQIMHNNKEVAKIEDSLGRILWQKPNITYPYMFMSNGSSYKYTKDYGVEGTWTSGVDAPFSVSGGQFFWSDGYDLYYSDNSVQYKYTGSLNNYDSTKWVAVSEGSSPSSIKGNDIIRFNNNLYSIRYNNRRVFNPGTGEGDSVTFTNEPSNISGDTVGTDGTDVYCNTGSSTIRVLDQNTLTGSSDMSITQTNASAYYYGTDGTDVYYSNGTTHKVWNKTYGNWYNKTWSGVPSNNFAGNEVFYYNDEIYVRQGRTPYDIYKLNKSTSTGTLAYTNPMGASSNFRGARMWDLGGRSTADTKIGLTGLRRPNK